MAVLDHVASILIVEDDEILGLMMASIVADAGLEPIGPHASPIFALDAMARQPIDAALLDLNLGEWGDSYPVATELRRRSVPFIFLTGHSSAVINQAFKEVPVLRKPVKEGALREAISLLLTAKRSVI